MSLPPSSFLPHVKLSSRRIWLYSQADISKINDLLSSTTWDTLLSSDIDSSWSALKARFLQVMHSCIPSKLRSYSAIPPWINRSLTAKMRTRQRLYRKVKSSSASLMSSYRSLRNSISSSLKNSKASFFHSLFHAPPSKFWSFAKSLHRTSSSIPSLSANGTIFESDPDKAQCLNSFIFSCFNSSVPPLSSIPPYSPPTSCPSSFLCSEDRIISLISHLPSKTASVPDGIPSWMLKSSTSSIAYPLCHTFNLSISFGLVPHEWKSSFVVPIPKSSPSSSFASTYRSISLLSLISKLLEKHMHSILYDFCINNDLIYHL